MKQLFIFSLEPIESRYTKQWFTHLPKVFSEKLGDEWEVIQINGDTNSEKPTDGAFLDFLSTNQWKNEQANKFFSFVKQGRVSNDAKILITDFWNPVLNELKYVKELLNKNWKIISFVHAGSYDPNDFLGRMDSKVKIEWASHTEKSLFNASDFNIFATQYHIDLFKQSYPDVSDNKIVRASFPMEYIQDEIRPSEKENLILFPHRIAPEKQVHVFDKLASMLPEYKFVVCQRENLTKQEYHNLLGKSKIVFSANLQETFGISSVEAIFAGSIPMLPDRLSYSEMYLSEFKYPSCWTYDTISYDMLALRIKKYIGSFDSYRDHIALQKSKLKSQFISCDKLVELIDSN